MFTKFEEEYLILESPNGTVSGEKYDDNSTLPPLISGAKTDEI